MYTIYIFFAKCAIYIRVYFFSSIHIEKNTLCYCVNNRWLCRRCIFSRSKYSVLIAMPVGGGREESRVPPISPQKFSLAATQGQSTRNNAVAIRVGAQPTGQSAWSRWWPIGRWRPTLRDEPLIPRALSLRVDEIKVVRVGSNLGIGLIKLRSLLPLLPRVIRLLCRTSHFAPILRNVSKLIAFAIVLNSISK